MGFAHCAASHAAELAGTPPMFATSERNRVPLKRVKSCCPYYISLSLSASHFYIHIILYIVCPCEVVTLRVNSGSELSVRLSSHSDTDSIGGDSNTPATPGLRLGNVRIVVEDGGRLTVGMAVDADVAGVCWGDGSAAAGEGISTLTLEGATAQVCAARAT